MVKEVLNLYSMFISWSENENKRHGKLTCNVDINKPAASTATYLPASLAVRKGVMICNVN